MSKQALYPGLVQAGAKSAAVRMQERQEGLAWARAWRVRNKPYFDALYGPAPGVMASAKRSHDAD